MGIAFKPGTLTRELRKKRQLSEALRMLKEDAKVGKETPVNWLIKPGDTHASRYIYGLLFSFTSFEKSEEDEPITPEIRMMLLDALIKEADDPKALGKHVTINQAMHYGRAEMIPTLVEKLGVEMKDRYFVRAAAPMNAPGAAIRMLSALRPYVKDVNVIEPDTGENAGHMCAYVGNLKAFMRLEVDGIRQKMKGEHIEVKDKNAEILSEAKEIVGLDKTARSKTFHPTYMHMAALCEDQEKAVPFIKYLAENGYEIDFLAKKHTPIESAAEQCLLDNALTLADVGATVTPEVLAIAIQRTLAHQRDIQDLLDFMDDLAKRELLDDEILVVAAERLVICEDSGMCKPSDICTTGKAVTDHAVRLGCADQIPAVPNSDYVDTPEYNL